MDCFRVLGLERRLVVSDETLREHYDARCREVHPDAGGGDPERFQELGKAYARLRSAGQRLAHWLELELGRREEGGEIPPALAAAFGELGSLFQEVDGIVARRGAARSALAQSLAEREALAVMPRLEAAGRELAALEAELVERFGRFEAGGAAACRAEAGEVRRGLAFLEKWQRELRERWAKLAG